MLTIIPQPMLMKCNESVNINFDSLFLKSSITFERVQRDFENFILDKTNFKISNDGYCVECIIDSNITNQEEYLLTVKQDSTKIIACCEQGLFRGMQTFKQILSQPVCECEISDKPKTNFRSMMLDVGRYFFPIEHIKEIIEWASFYKFNYFHIHLTEDQGWRFESKKYPLLTQLGSHRSHTNFNHKPEAGFYTQEQLKDLVKFAHDRFIKVIPEIDIPGHTVSAIACYKELSCFDRQLPVATHWGVKHDIMCAGKDFTYEFCKNIIDELCEVFDDEYLHIGGDEAPKMRWNVCPHCQNKIKELGLKNSEELQLYFTNVMAEYIAQKGKKTIMWNEENTPPTILNTDIIQQWWGTKISKAFQEKVNTNTKFINSNSSAYYIDLPYGYISLKSSYTTPVELEGVTNKDNFVGVETCLWTEYVKDIKKAKFNSFPRLGAIAEVIWSPQQNLDYKSFLKKLQIHKQFLNKYKIEMPSKRIYNPNPIRAFFSRIWFERRQLTWEGLHYLFDDKKVRKLAKKQASKTNKI